MSNPQHTQEGAENLSTDASPESVNESGSQPVTGRGDVTALNDLQNLPQVMVEVPESPEVKEPSLPMIGFHLSRFVLYIISGFILLLVVFLFVKNFDASNAIQIPDSAGVPDSVYAKKIELAKLISDEKKNYRDFILQISQMVLLNLLLPVLTAILGYIFASSKNRD